MYGHASDIARGDPRTGGDGDRVRFPRILFLQRPDDLSQEDRFPRPRRPGEKDAPTLIDDHAEDVALFRGEDDFLTNVERGVRIGASGGRGRR